MNIFAIEKTPADCAKSMVDKHVVKMVLETAQLLSTAHRVLDGTQYIHTKTLPSKRVRNVTKWKLNDDRENTLYSATHINHPSAMWCRSSNNNYNWLYAHFVALLDEYTYRYGKVHKCAGMIDDLRTPPHNIAIGAKTQVTIAMPDAYKVATDTLQSYRNYYTHGKAHLHKWTKRDRPEWIIPT